jgi:hydrogenase nickel incorporation protein HypB
MCTVCGCHAINHDHDHDHDRTEGGHSHRLIHLEKNILDSNNHYARHNRTLFSKKQILALNLVSSPGAGKTTLLVNTIEKLKSSCAIKVIEGDQQTSFDAEKIRATGVSAVQINTGKGCHLEAHGVGHALEALHLAPHELLFIENVGNLVCPAEFDLGEQNKVLILSVTEGDDKPLKYPHIFRAASLLLISKIDLLPYVDFDLHACIQYARQVNPAIEILALSSKTGEGMAEWFVWLERARQNLAWVV